MAAMVLAAPLEMAVPDRQAADRDRAGQDGHAQAIDALLIAACQRGEADALGQLFEAYKDRVYSIALRFSGDDATARDIAQDVFVKLFAQIKTFRGESKFESWLYRMVVNACLDERRRRRHWLPMLAEATADLFESLPRALSRGEAESALEHLMRHETQQQVQCMVAKLPADLRIVVVLRYTEGLSYDAIAEILHCPPGTVASRLNRAHKRLECRLAPLGSISRAKEKRAKEQ